MGLKKVLKLYGSPFVRDLAMKTDRELWGDMGTFYMSNKYSLIADIEYRYVFVQTGTVGMNIKNITKVVQCCTNIPEQHILSIRERLNVPFERRINEKVNTNMPSLHDDTGVFIESESRQEAYITEVGRKINRHKLSASEQKHKHLSGLCF